MSKTTTRITNFAAGMAADLRSPSGFARVQHFKVFPHRLVPQFSNKANETKSANIVKFVYAPWLSSGAYRLYGLGVDTGNPSRAAVLQYDIDSGTWPGITTPANNISSLNSRSIDVFFYYKLFIYMFAAGTSLIRFDTTGSAAFNDSYQSISYTSVAQPVHHPADDCAYFFHDNVVDRLNGTTYSSAVLTLPSDMVIVSADAHGDYLAIGCKSKSGLGNSIVYLWDRDSSLSTVTAKYNWGRGNLIHLASLEGVLTGVTSYFTNSLYAHDSGKLIIKQVVGGQPKTTAELPVTGVAPFNATNKFIEDDKLYFTFELARDGGYIHGIWSVDSQGRVQVPISEAEADAISTGVRYQGFYKTGEYWWIAHSNDGSVNRTDDQNSYTYTSILETTIIGKPDVKSQFVGASVSFEPLPASATVALKYRKVGTTSWTTVKSITSTGETVLSADKDTNGKALSFNELQYRIESTGGAVITGLEYTHETNDQKSYGRA